MTRRAAIFFVSFLFVIFNCTAVKAEEKGLWARRFKGKKEVVSKPKAGPKADAAKKVMGGGGGGGGGVARVPELPPLPPNIPRPPQVPRPPTPPPIPRPPQIPVRPEIPAIPRPPAIPTLHGGGGGGAVTAKEKATESRQAKGGLEKELEGKRRIQKSRGQ